MSGPVVSLIISLITGAAGGNIVGNLLKQFDIGPLGNSLTGIVGGGLGGEIITALIGGGAATGASRGLDVGTLAAQVVGGGAGGGILMIVVGVIRQMMGSKGT